MTTEPEKPLREDKGPAWFNESVLKLVASTVTALGTTCLLGYFVYITYFPPFDPAAIGGLLLSLSFVVLPLCALFSAVLLSPYVMIGVWIRARPRRHGDAHFNMELLWFVVTAAACFIFFGFALLGYAYMNWDMDWVLLLYLSFLLLIFCLYFTAVRSRHRRRHSKIYTPENALRYHRLCAWRRVRGIWITRFGNTIFVGLLTASPLSFVFLLLSGASDLQNDDLEAAAQAIFWTGAVVAIVGYFAIHLVYSPRWRRAWILCALMVFALPPVASILAHAPGVLPMSVAHVTKLGNFSANRIVMSGKACPLLSPYLELDCKEIGEKAFDVCNVHVMSRVGSESYLRIASREQDKASGYHIKAVLIPTAAIEGMEVDFLFRALRLDQVDKRLAKRSSSCPVMLLSLQADSSFGFNGFTLSDEGKQQLAELLRSISASAPRVEQIRVTGHADSVGTLAHNKWLALRRAEEVQLYLIREARKLRMELMIAVESKGSSEPVITSCKNHPQRIACEAPNRRVDIRIMTRPLLPLDTQPAPRP
ncbi:OmpA family protein [Pseudoduganella sp. SL102]|uniref:OmpA family protein n=1 Tax=Pseudoduganella sp. SL102 TaxID=2995154 RepID=UPI00248AAF3D|nr:OmpA family protein [Pseudoduganella sp. SL102]WBS04596.1 OmpA family protein [Pseudoduganella sp. SL102]